jgi:hypothetical protein
MPNRVYAAVDSVQATGMSAAPDRFFAQPRLPELSS